MKWILGYVLGATVLLAPAGLRLWLRSPSAPGPLDEAAVRQGEMLFTHEWTVNDPLANGGDGLGPVYNATSCAKCHFQGGVGGSGGMDHNVTTFTARGAGNGKVAQGVIHAFAIAREFQETLANADSGFGPIARPTLQQIQQVESTRPHMFNGAQVRLSQRNTPALFGAKLIDELSDQAILANERSQKVHWQDLRGVNSATPVGRALMLPDGKVGKFGWKAQSATLLSFVQAACANELGLGNPGQAQPTPLTQTSYRPRGLDLTNEQCQQMTAFIAALPRPVQRVPNHPRAQGSVERGRRVFENIGCAECHVANLGSIEGIYSDLLLHKMGDDLVGGGSYNSLPPSQSPGDDPAPDEWRTPPLWGVGDSAPYLHDGRAPTLHDAIVKHGGQAAESAQLYQRRSPADQSDLISFLKSLQAPR